MATKKKKKKKRSLLKRVLIPVALIFATLTTLGYLGKQSIEKALPETDTTEVVQATPLPDNTTNTKPQDKGSVKKDNTEKKDDKKTPTKEDTKKEDNTPVGKSPSYAGDASVKKLLQNALKPVGTTMYIYGGGWNSADTGASVATTTLGLDGRWKDFYSKQDQRYNHKNYSNRESGLDASGYIGWVLYNTLYTKNGESGFVYDAKTYDEKLSELGLGKRTPKSDVTVHRPGDIMSSQSDNFAYIVIGKCTDGSLVVALSSPPGVRLCGTPSADGVDDSEAVILAEQYMNDYFGDWYKKFPDCSKGMSYLTNYDKFSPDTSKVIKDSEGFRYMSANEVLKNLLG